MNEINFSEVKETDLNTLLDLYNYYLRNTTVVFDYKEIDIDEFKSRISFNNNKYKTFLMNHENKLIGFCFLTQYKNKPAMDRTAEIGIYLYPEYTKKGFGKIALEYLENHAGNNGIKVIIANISCENEASIKLFSKMNYVKCAHIKDLAVKFDRIQDVVYYQKIFD
jgi:phosphinothricin acetyltransferase